MTEPTERKTSKSSIGGVVIYVWKRASRHFDGLPETRCLVPPTLLTLHQNQCRQTYMSTAEPSGGFGAVRSGTTRLV